MRMTEVILLPFDPRSATAAARLLGITIDHLGEFGGSAPLRRSCPVRAAVRAEHRRLHDRNDGLLQLVDDGRGSSGGARMPFQATTSKLGTNSDTAGYPATSDRLRLEMPSARNCPDCTNGTAVVIVSKAIGTVFAISAASTVRYR